MSGARDGLLVVHVAAGALGLVLGLAAILAEGPPDYRSRAGAGYCWAVLVVALTALGLVAFDVASLWWLAPLAAISAALALLGYLAPRRRRRGWVRLYAHGQGGAYIALITALSVVSLDGPASVAGWVLPALAGVPLIERRVSRITSSCRSTTSPFRVPVRTPPRPGGRGGLHS